jgi:hypothetical protein
MKKQLVEFDLYVGDKKLRKFLEEDTEILQPLEKHIYNNVSLMVS